MKGKSKIHTFLSLQLSHGHFKPQAKATQWLLTWLFHMLRSVLTCHSSKASDPEQPIGIGRSRPRHAVSRFAVLRANSDVSTRRQPRLL